MGNSETHETHQSRILSERIERIRRDHDSRLRLFGRLLLSYNRKVNLVSRKSESSIFERHILHSLAVCAMEFPRGVKIADFGSGGGLPAIPLAIVQPDVSVVAIDAVFKKTQTIRAMAKRLQLNNMDIWNGRAENWDGSCTYSVSRATAPLVVLWRWHCGAFKAQRATPAGNFWKPGLICLKGGDLDGELAELREAFPDAAVTVRDLAPILGGAYFHEKRIVHVQA